MRDVSSCAPENEGEEVQVIYLKNKYRGMHAGCVVLPFVSKGVFRVAVFGEEKRW